MTTSLSHVVVSVEQIAPHLGGEQTQGQLLRTLCQDAGSLRVLGRMGEGADFVCHRVAVTAQFGDLLLELFLAAEPCCSWRRCQWPSIASEAMMRASADGSGTAMI